MKLRQKAADIWLGLQSWFSRQDGTNFRTNQVTYAQHMDAVVNRNPIGHAATWACVNLIAGTTGSLPLMMYRRAADGSREVARDHPLFWILHDSPNFDQTAVDFIEFIAASIELHGNAYAEIRRRSDGQIGSLLPVRPDIVNVRRNSAGELEYRWSENGREYRLSQKQMLHIRGFGGNALGGVSTLALLRATFNSALNAEQTASTMFANSARPSGVLSMEARLDAPQRSELETLLQEKFAGAMNAGRPMLLDNGLKWQQLDINPEDAQLLESRKFSGEEICRIFGVPPAMAGYGDKASNWGTGKEVDVLGFQKFTLRRRLKRIEQALQKQLLTPTDRLAQVTIEFNLEGLLRGDSAGRATFYQVMTQNGLMTINECRALENLPPVEGGDVPRMQMQNVPIDQVGELTGE